MGGCCCCCASKIAELNSSSPFYIYPTALEEHEPLSSPSGTFSTASTGLLVDTNLDTSTPDTYRAPPLPMPYESSSRSPQTLPTNQESCDVKSEEAMQTTNTSSIEENNTGIALESSTKDLKDYDCKVRANIEFTASKELEHELENSKEKKSNEAIFSALEEEDVCPICLEEYDEENPKFITKCEHHFHLACILEWMERSDTCPVCDQETIFNPPIDG